MGFSMMEYKVACGVFIGLSVAALAYTIFAGRKLLFPAICSFAAALIVWTLSHLA